MKVKGEVDQIKRSVEEEIRSLEQKSVQLDKLGHDVRAQNLRKIIIKMREWQNK